MRIRTQRKSEGEHKVEVGLAGKQRFGLCQDTQDSLKYCTIRWWHGKILENWIQARIVELDPLTFSSIINEIKMESNYKLLPFHFFSGRFACFMVYIFNRASNTGSVFLNNLSKPLKPVSTLHVKWSFQFKFKQPDNNHSQFPCTLFLCFSVIILWIHSLFAQPTHRHHWCLK